MQTSTNKHRDLEAETSGRDESVLTGDPLRKRAGDEKATMLNTTRVNAIAMMNNTTFF